MPIEISMISTHPGLLRSVFENLKQESRKGIGHSKICIIIQSLQLEREECLQYPGGILIPILTVAGSGCQRQKPAHLQQRQTIPHSEQWIKLPCRYCGVCSAHTYRPNGGCASIAQRLRSFRDWATFGCKRLSSISLDMTS